MSTFHGIFMYSRWDSGNGGLSYLFYDVTLVVPVKHFPAGTKFDCVYWDYEKLKMYIGDDIVGLDFKIVPA
jgi:hypothetical protein